MLHSMQWKKKKNDSDKYDSVYIETETSKRNKLTIGSVYRPPKQQAADDAALYEEFQAMTQNKQSVIIGDFNCTKIYWSTMHGDQEGNRLLEMLEDTFMTQITTQPTRKQYPWPRPRDWPWPRPRREGGWKINRV